MKDHTCLLLGCVLIVAVVIGLRSPKMSMLLRMEDKVPPFISVKEWSKYEAIPGYNLSACYISGAGEKFLTEIIIKMSEQQTAAERTENRKSLCYGCENSLKCFTEQLLKDYKALSNGTLSHVSSNKILQAFAPQTWHCNLAKQANSESLVYYDQFNRRDLHSQLVTNLNKNGVPAKSVMDITKGMNRKTDRDEKKFAAIHKIIRNKILFDWYAATALDHIYFYDFAYIKHVLGRKLPLFREKYYWLNYVEY